ncbi:DNA translocase FtsK 4TM domain-containing protein [Granulosicoccaceae sp. 1_MG-2023]|nr:DNA translocase FtsK 4TM domain-containing protein [Granulosicoccaceae sp. 1_MG-2023]
MNSLSRARSPEAVGHLSRGVREITGITMMAVAAVLLLALMSFNVADPGWSHTGLGERVRNAGGVAGAWFADVTFYLLGYMGFLVPAIVAFLGWVMFYESRPQKARNAPFTLVRLTGLAIMLPTACGLADLHFAVTPDSLPLGVDGGGLLGSVVAGTFVQILSPLGATLILLALFLGSFSLATRISWLYMTEAIGGVLLGGVAVIADGIQNMLLAHSVYRQEKAVRREQMRELRAAEKAAQLKQREQARILRQQEKEQARAEREARKAERLAAAKEKARQAAEAARNAKAQLALAREQAQQPGLDEDEDHIPVLLKKPQQAKRGADEPAAAKPPVAEQKVPQIPVPEKPKAAKKIKPVAKRDDKQYKLFEGEQESALPPLSMLDEPQPQSIGYSELELENMSRLLEERLADFKVTAEVVAVQPGPVITRFELELAPGTKASKISGLSSDIARSMSLVSVRVVEVIRGKSTIGIEIPNEKREIVQLSEIIRSKKYSDSKSPLTLALGKDIGGNPVVADLAKMPHLLVAGTTGSGKSVGVNTMLTSLLYKSTADEVRLILIDPKMLELSVYEDIPHLLAPVVTDMKEAANALRWSVGEMERRYKLMSKLGVRNIAGYNKKVRQAIEDGEPIEDPLYKKEEAFDPEAPVPTLEPLPYIVVVVDEFADMIMVVGKKVEELIARIAQKARAAGIHLILATQRPSTDVITGLIKSNIPTRMAFQVSTKLDSRIILDQGGAESLLGHGDMLFLPPGTAQAERVHGAFIDDHEVHNVVGYLKQQGEANYIEGVLDEPSSPIPGLPADIAGGDDGGDKDALYDQAVAIVTESRKASISYVQRRLRIGYNRAARLVEEMEEGGVVSQVRANGQREVLAPPPPPA